jgi:hypothetical protein
MIEPLRSAAHTATKPETPIDHTHEMPAIRRLERSGYTAEFIAEGGDTLRVSGTNRRYAADDARIHDFYPLRGHVRSRRHVDHLRGPDGRRHAGTLIDAFGTYADPAIAAIVDRMDFRPIAA